MAANNVFDITADEIEPYHEDGSFTGDEDYIQTQTDKAVRALCRLVRSLPARVTSGDIDRALVVDVVADAVLRVYRGRDGLKSETEGIYSYDANPLVVSGDLWFSDRDLALFDTGNVTVPTTAHSRTPPGWMVP